MTNILLLFHLYPVLVDLPGNFDFSLPHIMIIAADNEVEARQLAAASDSTRPHPDVFNDWLWANVIQCDIIGTTRQGPARVIFIGFSESREA